MELREYLFRNRMTVKQLSDSVECARTHLSEIIHGRRWPSKRLARDIEKATDGQVTVSELLKGKGE